MTRQQVPLLRVVLVALALVAVLTQALVVPWVASGYVDAYPEVAHLAQPYVIAVVVAFGGFEVALLAAWLLLSAANAGDASPCRSKRWANALAASLAFMATLFAGVCAHAAFIANVGGPPVLFGLLVSLALVPAAFALRRGAVGFSLGNGGARLGIGHAH